jgi:hypothetical protein
MTHLLSNWINDSIAPGVSRRANLSRLQSNVEKRNTMPILANVLLEARKKGKTAQIELAATDLEVGIRSVHPAPSAAPEKNPPSQGQQSLSASLAIRSPLAEALRHQLIHPAADHIGVEPHPRAERLQSSALEEAQRIVELLALVLLQIAVGLSEHTEDDLSLRNLGGSIEV